MAVHNQTGGLRWSLYPLLATIALCEFMFGIGHLSFCLPFSPFLLPIITGIFALIAAFHALFLRVPNRADFILQCSCTTLGLFLLITSFTEAFCGIETNKEEDGDGDEKENMVTMSQGFCYGIHYRSASFQASCKDFLRPFHTSLASKLNMKTDLKSLQFIISFSMTGLALAHTTTCIALAFYSAQGNGYDFRSYHCQLIVALLMLPAALLHRFYCCTYFYLWPGVLVSCYAFFQAWLSWRYKCRGRFVRSVNIIGSAAALSLCATASFGIFCTNTRLTNDHFPFQRHCNWPAEQYRYCQRVIEFGRPYSEWQHDMIIAETNALQNLTNTWLSITAFALFCLSVTSAFTTNNYYIVA